MSFGNFGMDNRYPPDWMCVGCGHVNFARRAVCEQCAMSRTANAPPAYAPTHASVRAGTVSATALATGLKAGFRPSPFAFSALPAYSSGMGGARQPAMLMPGDWCCPNPNCGHLNFAKRTECQVCKTSKSYHGPRGYGMGMGMLRFLYCRRLFPHFGKLPCNDRLECQKSGSGIGHTTFSFSSISKCICYVCIICGMSTPLPRRTDDDEACEPNHHSLPELSPVPGLINIHILSQGPSILRTGSVCSATTSISLAVRNASSAMPRALPILLLPTFRNNTHLIGGARRVATSILPDGRSASSVASPAPPTPNRPTHRTTQL